MFRETKQKCADTSTQEFGVYAYSHVDLSIIAAPDVGKANKLPFIGDDYPGIGIQDETWSLPVSKQFLLGIIRHTVFDDVTRYK